MNFAHATNFIFVHDSSSHETTKFMSLGSLASAASAAASAGAKQLSAVSAESAKAMAAAQEAEDAPKPIDAKAEIARINSNIAMYHAGLAIGAIGLGLAMCFFVRSILKPPKGSHGGDSDDEMDSEEEDDDDEESED